MDQEAWGRFKNRSRRITSDWILGGLFGLGIGWLSASFVGTDRHPSLWATIGCVTTFIAIFVRPLCNPDFWRGQFGKSGKKA